MKPLIIHSEARREFEVAMSYSEARRAGLALALEMEIGRLFDKIRAAPALGSPYKRTKFRFRILRRFQFVVYYQEFDFAIWVVAIAHGKRRLGYWLRRRFE